VHAGQPDLHGRCGDLGLAFAIGLIARPGLCNGGLILLTRVLGSITTRALAIALARCSTVALRILERIWLCKRIICVALPVKRRRNSLHTQSPKGLPKASRLRRFCYVHSSSTSCTHRCRDPPFTEFALATTSRTTRPEFPHTPRLPRRRSRLPLAVQLLDLSHLHEARPTPTLRLTLSLRRATRRPHPLPA
jgi:hypothetical protein